jgi:peptide chain release factor 3
MNKCDRPTRNPLELLDELESVLGIHAFPMNWPLGDGPSFRGVYDRQGHAVHLFEKTVGGMYRAPVAVHGLDDAAVREALDEETYRRASEELAMLDAAGTAFDAKRVLAGEVTPVFFGSATNNFGVQLMLDGFLELAPTPSPRKSGDRVIPVDGLFSAFVFKIQGNMDPRHRDRVCFIRVCSGKFERDMLVTQTRTGKKFKLSNAHKLFGQEREILQTAYAGDIVGLVGYDVGMGDTLSEDPTIVYNEIPRFPPECFSFIHNPTPSKYKPFRRGLDQLLSEGLVQSFQVRNGQNAPLLAAVGPLQFEVVQFRLQSEYGADARLESTPWQLMRWVDPSVPRAALEEVRLPPGAQIADDPDGRPVVLFDAEWALRYFRENQPGIELHAMAPALSAS